jgi:hypothetical protein
MRCCIKITIFKQQKYFACIIATLLFSCSPKIHESIWFKPPQYINEVWKPSKVCFQTASCAGSNKYENHTPIKYVQLSFHFIRDPKQPYFSAYEASIYANDLVRLSNEKLANNQPMNLPTGNNTPVLPIRYRYAIATDSASGREAVYFHNDSELAYMNKKDNNKNLFWKAQYEKYGFKNDGAIDVFMLEHPKDSIGKPTYKASLDGVGMSNWMKIVGAYQYSIDSFTDDAGIKIRKWAEQFCGLFNHEAGHIVGLPHTWQYNDGCDDTPQHTNCWCFMETPPCDKEVSNNMMDYNTYQNSLTPCQIGKVNYNLTDKNYSIRKYLYNTWCAPQKLNDVVIPKNTTIEWQCNKELEGNVVLKENSTLIIYCSLSMPQNSSIKIYPGAKLVLNGGKIHNDCGLLWKGVEVLSSEKGKGSVQLLNAAIIENTISN